MVVLCTGILEGKLLFGYNKGMANNLTLKQYKFVSAYLELGNGVKAAKLAGYQGNPITLASVSYENLRKPHISSEIRSRLEDADMGQAFVLKHLKRIAEDEEHPTHSMQALDRLAHFLEIEIGV
jgi:phage terminase small subunit